MEQSVKTKVIPLRENASYGQATSGLLRTRNNGHLFSNPVDCLLIGGLSILFFGVTYCFVDPSASINSISWTAYYLVFIVNWPHFLVSYQLLYLDNRKKLFKEMPFTWAAFI